MPVDLGDGTAPIRLRHVIVQRQLVGGLASSDVKG
jgi:hypothetical protein